MTDGRRGSMQDGAPRKIAFALLMAVILYASFGGA